MWGFDQEDPTSFFEQDHREVSETHAIKPFEIAEPFEFTDDYFRSSAFPEHALVRQSAGKCCGVCLHYQMRTTANQKKKLEITFANHPLADHTGKTFKWTLWGDYATAASESHCLKQGNIFILSSCIINEYRGEKSLSLPWGKTPVVPVIEGKLTPRRLDFMSNTTPLSSLCVKFTTRMALPDKHAKWKADTRYIKHSIYARVVFISPLFIDTNGKYCIELCVCDHASNACMNVTIQGRGALLAMMHPEDYSGVPTSIGSTARVGQMVFIYGLLYCERGDTVRLISYSNNRTDLDGWIMPLPDTVIGRMDAGLRGTNMYGDINATCSSSMLEHSSSNLGEDDLISILTSSLPSSSSKTTKGTSFVCNRDDTITTVAVSIDSAVSVDGIDIKGQATYQLREIESTQREDEFNISNIRLKLGFLPSYSPVVPFPPSITLKVTGTIGNINALGSIFTRCSEKGCYKPTVLDINWLYDTDEHSCPFMAYICTGDDRHVKKKPLLCPSLTMTINDRVGDTIPKCYLGKKTESVIFGDMFATDEALNRWFLLTPEKWEQIVSEKMQCLEGKTFVFSVKAKAKKYNQMKKFVSEFDPFSFTVVDMEEKVIG